MSALNKPIARMAKKEDRYTGQFLGSRFKSQALLDEKALAGAMAYVDLNSQPLLGARDNRCSKGLPFHLKEYIELVHVTGRAIRDNKRGYIDSHFPPILKRLSIKNREWMVLTTQFESRFKSLVGCKEKLVHAAQALKLKRRPAYSQREAMLHQPNKEFATNARDDGTAQNPPPPWLQTVYAG